MTTYATTNPPTLLRNAFWHGKSMGVQEFQWEQTYHRMVQQTLARLAVGCGVLCGLDVVRAGTTGVVIGHGAAIDGDGRLILVPRDLTLNDIAAWICLDDSADGTAGAPPGHYELCLLYHECPVAPTPALVTDCDTRLECKPSAVEERYRFEARPIERVGCDDLCRRCERRLQPGRACDCASDGTDCVPIARFEWSGQEITGLTVEGRTEVASNRQLYDLLTCGDACDPTAVVAPRLVGMWPAPGTTLDREGSPSEWARWRYRPRLELTFDRPVGESRIDDPGDWIRAWAVFGEGGDITVERIGLEYLDEVDGKACGEHTLVFELVDDATLIHAAMAGEPDRAAAFSVVVQARCGDDTGPVGAGPVPRPAHIEYAGTTLTSEERARLWAQNEYPDGGPDPLVPDPLPACFGDGYDGGLLHAAFTVGPIEGDPIVTAVHPHNGARLRTDDVPAIEVSSSGVIPGLAPRAWLIEASSHVELPMTGGDLLGPDEQPRAGERFRSVLDRTLEHELDQTVRYENGGVAPPGEVLRGGRVLVIIPATTSEGQAVGAFAGTCLREEQVAQIYADQPTPDIYPHIRPSDRRMPRAGTAGDWIHWTFAWERADDLNY